MTCAVNGEFRVTKLTIMPEAIDPEDVETFLGEFRAYEKNGDLPHFIVMSLGEDHTEATRTGAQNHK